MGFPHMISKRRLMQNSLKIGKFATDSCQRSHVRRDDIHAGARTLRNHHRWKALAESADCHCSNE